MCGLDVSRHMPDIRHDLGCCPQFDMLWPDLTVSEHLQLFAAIKGVPLHSATEGADLAAKAAAEVGLVGCMDQLAGVGVVRRGHRGIGA